MQLIDAVAVKCTRSKAAGNKLALALTHVQYFNVTAPGNDLYITRERQVALMVSLQISKGAWNTLRDACCPGWMCWDTISRVRCSKHWPEVLHCDAFAYDLYTACTSAKHADVIDGNKLIVIGGAVSISAHLASLTLAESV